MNALIKFMCIEHAATPAPWVTQLIQDSDDGNWYPCPTSHDPEAYDGNEDEANDLAKADAENDAELIDALRNLAPELMALWAAVEDQHEYGNTNDLRPNLFPALAALNAKAEEVLRG